MNALVKSEATAISTMPESELLEVLQSSLYPGAAIPSIKMVLGYCKAAGLDPMQKPVHIVPMWDSKAKQMRDVVMPGIGLYRTQAARTGEHVGTDEPIFGPMVELQVGDFVIQHPEWCKVTVYRMVNGMKCAYTATEYWVENYATAGKDTIVPNTMWKKRTRGQIAKCAEAQALRKGFPEVGNQPTAEEMEGKVLDMGAAEVVQPSAVTGSAAPAQAPTTSALPEFTDVHLKEREAKIRDFYSKGKTADEIIAFYALKATLSDAMKKAIRDMAPKQATSGDAVQDVQVKHTYAQVAERLNAAEDQGQLEAAKALIPSVADADHRTELEALAARRADELPAF